MNKPLLILFLLLSYFSLGQNLIPNPSFEVYDVCPNQVSDPTNFELNHSDYWNTPSQATSDYFNSCNINPNSVSVPLNFMGHQIPFHGDCYAGILLLLEEGESSWYEYLESDLMDTLRQGKEYNVTFRVNLANNSNFAVSEIGLWFTTGVSNATGTGKLFTTLPDIKSNIGFLVDTSEWIEINGVYTAMGDETNIIIGFYTDSINTNAHVEPVSDFAALESIDSYYYVDAVSIEQINIEEPKETFLEIPNVITPNNDGLNDQFEFNFAYSKVSIFNRWGNLIWIDFGDFFWNGETTEGNRVSEGIYFYIIETEKKKYQGYVQVIR